MRINITMRAGLATLAAIITLSGCGPVYMPAIYDSNMSPGVPLRMSTAATYAGADVARSVGYNTDESNTFARGRVAWGTGGVGWRTSVEGFVYGGRYDVRWAGNSPQGAAGYFGLGGMFDGNLAIHGDRASLGLGLNVGAALEGGDYATIWRDGRVPIAPMIGAYLFTSLQFAGDQWMELEGHVGFPGMSSLNLRFSIDRCLFWGGVGATTASEGRIIGFHRIQAGASLRLN
jgi:hypothetical protein